MLAWCKSFARVAWLRPQLSCNGWRYCGCDYQAWLWSQLLQWLYDGLAWLCSAMAVAAVEAATVVL